MRRDPLGPGRPRGLRRRLLLYIDGLTEARRAGELFGKARLEQILDTAGDVTARDLGR